MNLEQYVRKGNFYKAVVEDGSDLIFIVDFDGRIAYHNASVRPTLGYRPRSLIGKNFFDFILPSLADELKTQFRKSQRKAYTENVEFQFRCADKSYRFLEFNAINLKFKEGVNGFILDCRDITQRKRDAEELVRLQKAKEQFLANISHEIRTPINGIAGMANLLGQNPSAEERETYLNAIRHSAENLKVIINDILDLAAIESGKLRFEQIAFNLTDLIPSLINTFQYQAREKNIALHYSLDERLNRILLGDPVRLNQILINLVSNAVKFTHRGGIRVTGTVEKLQKKKCWVRLEVRDTGVGIPSEKLQTIFESFSQADASVTRKYGGSGLGLTIVRQLVELQHGTITVESELNKGSVFTVTIPYVIANTRKVTRSSSPKTDPPVNTSTVPYRILLVEDNDINRLYAESILKNWKCRVDIAENGLVAIEKIKGNDYDLVLMDVQMPVMDGYEATRAIRLMPPPKRDVTIVALTANVTRADLEKCFAAGMNDYLPKPFTPEDLHRKIFRDMKVSLPSPSPEPLPQSHTHSTFDLTFLRTVSGNNKTFIREMIETFVETTPKVLSAMRASVEKRDWKKLAQLAHRIKPSLTLMGMEVLRKQVMSIEEKAENETALPDTARLVYTFVQDCQKAVQELVPIGETDLV